MSKKIYLILSLGGLFTSLLRYKTGDISEVTYITLWFSGYFFREFLND